VKTALPSWLAYRALPLACLLGFLLSGAAAGAGEPSVATLAAQVGSAKDEAPHGVRRHYMWSNERRHDLFFADLAGTGGGYLGVGGDQNYTMAAAAGVKVLWLIDLDIAVVRMHRLYAALLAAAETPAAFVSLLDSHHKQAVYQAVASYHQALAEDERRAVLAIYHAYREDLSQHLRATAEFRWADKPVTWLADPAMYSHLRQLAIDRLIVPRLGDLTGPTTVQEIAQAARAASVPVRVIYLSNAESWFRYGREFRRNLTALPVDERSVVLRTIKSVVLSYPHGDIWHYSVQRADHFAQHLGERDYGAVDVAMVDAEPCYSAADNTGKKPTPRRGLSHIGFPGSAPALASAQDASTDRLRRKKEREQRTRREQLLAAGLVTRPEGNRVQARQMDRERYKRVEKELGPSVASAASPSP
jgi:hypothetical protein